MTVRGILSCGCVFIRDPEGFRDAKGSAVAVGTRLWCPNHYAAVELEALDPLAPTASGGAPA